jgi:hypothetical protein
MNLYLIVDGELIIEYYKRPSKVYSFLMKREWARRDCRVVQISLTDLSILRTRSADDFIFDYQMEEKILKEKVTITNEQITNRKDSTS